VEERRGKARPGHQGPKGQPRRGQWVSPVSLNPEQEARYQAFVRARKAANPDCTRVSRSAWARNLDRTGHSGSAAAGDGQPPQDGAVETSTAPGRVPPPPPQPRREAASAAPVAAAEEMEEVAVEVEEVSEEEASAAETFEEETTSHSASEAAPAQSSQPGGATHAETPGGTKEEEESSGEDTPRKATGLVRKTTALKSKASPGRTPAEESPVTADGHRARAHSAGAALLLGGRVHGGEGDRRGQQPGPRASNPARSERARGSPAQHWRDGAFRRGAHGRPLRLRQRTPGRFPPTRLRHPSKGVLLQSRSQHGHLGSSPRTPGLWTWRLTSPTPCSGFAWWCQAATRLRKSSVK